MSKFGITARQFNAIQIGLIGKIDSVKVRRSELIKDLQTKIKRAEKTIANIYSRPNQEKNLHQKKRWLAIMQGKLVYLQADHKADKVRLCFGSRRLFNAQFNLEENGYANHNEWKKDWQESRSNQFFVLGSGDETAGNQSCQVSVQNNGFLSLKLRLPDALVKVDKNNTNDEFKYDSKYDSKCIHFNNIRFAYGHQAIVDAIATSKRIHAKKKAGAPIIKLTGSAISYRFIRDKKGWRVMVSVQAQSVPQVSRKMLGAIGVDINADHLPCKAHY